MAKAILKMIATDFPDLVDHINIIAGQTESGIALLVVKYFRYNKNTGMFTSLMIISSNKKLHNLYKDGIDKTYWYDSIIEKTTNQHLQAIRASSIHNNDRAAAFMDFMLRVVKNNKYRYSAIQFNLIALASIKLSIAKHTEAEGYQKIIEQNQNNTTKVS